MADTQWLSTLQRLARDTAAESAAMPRFRMFGHVLSCIDGRCGVPVYGRHPYKQHRILASFVDDRNAPSVQQRLGHDAARASMRGMRQLVVCETHTDCAYRKLRGLSQEQVWKSCRKLCARLLNTTPVWVSRDVATGAVTVVGERGEVEAAAWHGQAGVEGHRARCEELLREAGFHGSDLVHDLALFLQGNLAYLRTPHRFDRHLEEGIVVGSGIPGAATHLSISNRMEHLPEALGIATSIIGRREVAAPFVAVAIARHPHKPAQRGQYLGALQALRQSVETALADLGLADQYAVRALFSTKGSGELALAG